MTMTNLRKTQKLPALTTYQLRVLSVTVERRAAFQVLISAIDDIMADLADGTYQPLTEEVRS